MEPLCCFVKSLTIKRLPPTCKNPVHSPCFIPIKPRPHYSWDYHTKKYGNNTHTARSPHKFQYIHYWTLANLNINNQSR